MIETKLCPGMPERKVDVIESKLCPDCGGTGYVPNDPDISRLQLCLTCEGDGLRVEPERDFAMERAKEAAEREDAEEGRQERIREQLEAAFSKDDPDEACPMERRTDREIKAIAAMILQEAIDDGGGDNPVPEH